MTGDTTIADAAGPGRHDRAGADGGRPPLQPDLRALDGTSGRDRHTFSHRIAHAAAHSDGAAHEHTNLDAEPDTYHRRAISTTHAVAGAVGYPPAHGDRGGAVPVHD